MADAARRRAWAGAVLALAPLAAFGAGTAAAEKGPRPDEPVEPGFLEFLAEEDGLDEELSEALMSGELDREMERSAKRREVQGDVKNEG